MINRHNIKYKYKNRWIKQMNLRLNRKKMKNNQKQIYDNLIMKVYKKMNNQLVVKMMKIHQMMIFLNMQMKRIKI